MKAEVETLKFRKLRHRVTIQQFVQGSDDGIGGTVDTWQDVDTIWARIEPLNSRDTLISQQLQLDATHQVEIRYRGNINSKMRLIHRGRILDNISIKDNDELNKVIHLLCREVR
jgi:SPP1 family predicted phage head-tail adaptor